MARAPHMKAMCSTVGNVSPVGQRHLLEPGLGALDMAADFRNDPPEPRRVVHLDEMRHFMGGEIIQHIGWRQDQPPGKRQ